MRLAFVHPLNAPLFALLAAIGGMATAPAMAVAQTQNGTIAGRIVDTAGAPIAASISVLGNARYGVFAAADGAYAIAQLPAGAYRLQAHFIGFKPDTFAVTVTAGQTAYHHVVLHADANTLKSVVVTSPRLNETTAGALQEQKDADNIITVMSGDEIRALPNANAAEALARLPGVTAERDEGEGKYVEIRGTPPDFQHVTIDGADVPGTLATDVRAVKLDDVPADLLGAIEVSKTLTADQDARAIGGSVNLVTKVPEGAPHGYFSGTYAYQSLQSNNNGQANMSYGGRVGDVQKFGFLFSGTYDRTNRVINDVEPAFQADVAGGPTGFTPVPNGSAFTHVFPTAWGQREYDYYRTRYGAGGDLDYRFSPTSSIYVKGLWSAFFDEANRWETDVSGGTDALVNGVPTVTDGSVSNAVANRGPIEHTWGFTGGGKQDLGHVHLSYAANYAGSQATQHDHYQDDYNGVNNLSSFSYTYNTSPLIPTYSVSPAVRSAIANPSNYQLGTLETDNELNSGQTVGEGRCAPAVPTRRPPRDVQVRRQDRQRAQRLPIVSAAVQLHRLKPHHVSPILVDLQQSKFLRPHLFRVLPSRALWEHSGRQQLLRQQLGSIPGSLGAGAVGQSCDLCRDGAGDCRLCHADARCPRITHQPRASTGKHRGGIRRPRHVESE